jgi:hypothetical protein
MNKEDKVVSMSAIPSQDMDIDELLEEGSEVETPEQEQLV